MRYLLYRIHLLLLLMILGGIYPEQSILIFGFILFNLVSLVVDAILENKYWEIKRVERRLERHRKAIEKNLELQKEELR